jgi:hypothetical protein
MEPEQLMSLEIVKTIALSIGAGAALFTAVQALRAFQTNLKVRRAEWLSTLYDSFYVKSELKGIRAALDYPGSEHDELLRCIDSDKENWVRLEPLVDYLNFFEFIAVLWIMNQLSIEEIKLMFGYYLRRLGEERSVVEFCREGGFKNLLRLLEKLGYVESAKT